MRVLVTGATGFLGRHLVPRLAPHDVTCLVHPGDRTPLPEGVRRVTADLTQEGPWRDDVVRFAPDWCIHLAWEGLPDYSLARCRSNLDAGVGLIQTLAAARVGRVVVAGSCWEYGRASGPVTEDQAPVDCGVFAATKHALRTVLDGVSRDAGFTYRWARIFFVYGPGQRPTSLIPHLRASYAAGQRPSVREPDSVQDFIHVDDVASGLVALAACDAPAGVFNLGTGQPSRVRDVAALVARGFGQPPPFDEVTAAGSGFWADPSRTEQASGFRARIGLAEGVARVLEEPAVLQ